MADSPSADAIECTRQPSDIPNVVANPEARPREIAFFVTSAVSAPGVMVRTAAMPMNTGRSVMDNCHTGLIEADETQAFVYRGGGQLSGGKKCEKDRNGDHIVVVFEALHRE